MGGILSLLEEAKAGITAFRETHATAEAGLTVAGKVVKGGEIVERAHSDPIDSVAEAVKAGAGASEKVALLASTVPLLGQVAEVVEHVGAAGAYGAAGLVEAGNAAAHGHFKDAGRKVAGAAAGAAITVVPYIEVGDIAVAAEQAGQHYVKHEKTGMNLDTIAQRTDKEVQALLGGGTHVETSGGQPPAPPSATPGQPHSGQAKV